MAKQTRKTNHSLYCPLHCARRARAAAFVCAALLGLGAGCRSFFTRSNTLRDVQPPSATADLVVTGLVSCIQPAVLVPRTETHVRLWDASLAGAEPTCVADAVVTSAEAFPIPYSLRLPKAEVRPTHAYYVTASVAKDGTVLFKTDTEYSVPVGDDPVAAMPVVIQAK